MPKGDNPPKSARAQRDEKLAAALRANLRRRKAGATDGPAKSGAADRPKTP